MTRRSVVVMPRVILFLCLLLPSTASFAQWPDEQRRLICELAKRTVTPKDETCCIYETVIVDVTRTGDQLTIAGRGIDIVFSISTGPTAKDREDHLRWAILEGRVTGDREYEREIFITKKAKKSGRLFHYNSIEMHRFGDFRQNGKKLVLQEQITGTCKKY